MVRIEERNPEILFKAVKNWWRSKIFAMHRSGTVAHVRFMKWLKENVGKSRITEMSASEKIG